jgi:ketosteroid isomerase-like protein
MADDDIERVRSVYAAMARQDGDQLADALAHDIEWTMPEVLPWGGTRHGPDGIRAMVELFAEHVEGAWADPDDYLDAGDRIVVLGRARGTVRATGEEYEVGFSHVWTLTDGVPSAFRAYLDPSEIVSALGATP